MEKISDKLELATISSLGQKALVSHGGCYWGTRLVIGIFRDRAMCLRNDSTVIELFEFAKPISNNWDKVPDGYSRVTEDQFENYCCPPSDKLIRASSVSEWGHQDRAMWKGGEFEEPFNHLSVKKDYKFLASVPIGFRRVSQHEFENMQCPCYDELIGFNGERWNNKNYLVRYKSCGCITGWENLAVPRDYQFNKKFKKMSISEAQRELSEVYGIDVKITE